MKRVLAVLVFAFISVLAYSQEESKVELDTIYKLGGRQMNVNVLKITSSSITYSKPGTDVVETISRKKVQKVVHSSGKIEVFNKPVFQMIEDFQWEAVVMTENPKEVEGLYKRGKIEAESPPSSRSRKAAKRSCTIRMQKKAANMKGIMILVTHREATGGYGELPGYYMEGVVYGFDPPEEEEGATQASDGRDGVIF